MIGSVSDYFRSKMLPLVSPRRDHQKPYDISSNGAVAICCVPNLVNHSRIGRDLSIICPATKGNFDHRCIHVSLLLFTELCRFSDNLALLLLTDARMDIG